MNTTFLSGDTTPVLDCQCQTTVVGPLAVIRAVMVTTCGGASQATFITGGSTRTCTFVTLMTGEFTTGSACTSPMVSTNSAESQQDVDGSVGLRTYHQLESWFRPMISACLPSTRNPTIA